MGKLDEAIHDLNGVLDSLSAFNEYNKNDRDIFISTYDNLILAYLNKGDRNKMNLTLKQKDDFIKQFHEVQLKQELEKLQVQYETKEKESEILRLEIVNDNQVILQKRQQAVFFGLIGLLLVILSGVWFYFYQRNLNNKYKRVVLQQQLLRTQMDPHFTFNALNSIVVLNKERPKEVENYVLSLSKLVRLILENSREEFVSMKKEVEALENYLLLQSNFSKKFTFKINITAEIEPEYYEIPPMMVQPFVENAIIHGIASKKQNGHIEISFTSKDDKMMQCTIQDNGIGYYMTKQTNSHTSRKHTSLSEQIINERLAIYSRKFKTDTSINIQELKNKKNEPIGTNVKVLLPLNII
jgi:sensor histidine kinase YesM